MLIVGLDIARTCGIGLVRPGQPASTWRALALRAEGDDVWSVVDDYEGALRALLLSEKPDFAAIERPLDVIVDHGAAKTNPVTDRAGKPQKRMINAKTTITLSALCGVTIGVLNSLEIPYGIIAIPTWRKAYFGGGVKPVDGDWKALAVSWAERQGVLLPPTKAREDAAEAVGIGVSWQACNHIPARHHRAFMNLRTGRAAA